MIECMTKTPGLVVYIDFDFVWTVYFIIADASTLKINRNRLNALVQVNRSRCQLCDLKTDTGHAGLAQPLEEET